MMGNTSTGNQNDAESRNESKENHFNLPTTDSRNNSAPIEQPVLTNVKFMTKTATTSFTFESCKYTLMTLFNNTHYM